ncbi:ion transporter [bacterium]|nr:ion transporter [bacterium]
MRRIKEWCRRTVGRLWFELPVFVMILVSVVLLGEEALVPIGSPQYKQIMGAQAVITGIFVVELSIRYGASRELRSFVRDCWLDILAILPGLQVFRIGAGLRVLRLLRILRLARLVKIYSLPASTRTVQSLGVIVLLAAAVLVGTLGLAATRGFSLEGLVHSFWSSIFSFLSSEYVDRFPPTVGGKLTVLMLILAGISFFSILTGSVSAVVTDRMKRGSTLLEGILLNELQDHILICGWNSGVLTTLHELQSHTAYKSRDFVIISELEIPPNVAHLPNPRRIRFVRDDFTRIAALRRAGLERAAIALIMADQSGGRSPQDADARTVLAALTIEKLHPNILSCAELSSSESEPHLRLGGINEVVLSGELAGSLLAQAAIDSGQARIFQNLLHPSFGSRIQLLPLDPNWIGKTFTDILGPARTLTGVIPIAVKQSDGTITINPGAHVITAQDQLFGIEGDSQC